jgi:flagellar motor switch protein FliN/FliY
MLSIPAPILTKFELIQSQIWQTVSMTVSEAAGMQVALSNPRTASVRTTDLYAEMSNQMMVIQFSFANMPENNQVILIPEETVSRFVNAISDNPVTEIDENIVADLRAPLEAIVQGICLSTGNIKNETIVASGLNIRYQVFSFPPNLQRSDDIVRVTLDMSGDDLEGPLMWLVDSEVVHMILGIVPVEEEYANPFGQVQLGGGQSGGTYQFPSQGGTSYQNGQDETHGLDLLMDIPLEISVELGRVKMLVRDVVELSTGSIVEIDKAAGEPVDVMVNGRLVARGEVVVIEDNFGVRVTEILNPHERLTRLGEVA